jgi:hypothetical protein
MSMSFKVSDVEFAKLEEWKKEHEKTCVYHGKTMANPANMRYFSPSSPVTYCFTPTGIGDVVKLKCLCGEVVDITDYDMW